MLPAGFFNALLFVTLERDCWSAYKWIFVDIFRFDIFNNLVTAFMYSSVSPLMLHLKVKREREKALQEI